MGKTPAQQNRLKAKQSGMSHESVRDQEAKEIREQKRLANKDVNFGREKGLHTRDAVMKQRLKDMNDPTTELGKATARAARKAAKEAEEFLLRTKGISIKQKEVPEGVDPKTILCEYFRYSCCAKTAEKCKFAHDLNIGQKIREGNAGSAKRNLYDNDEADEGDTMELWDQDKLESVIAKKHSSEKTQSNATQIICKHFLDAVETRKYGWFWACPGGDGCKYKHKLPKDYVFKSDLVAMMRAAALNKKSDQDELREELEKLKDGPKTPVTLDVFLEWKTKKVEGKKAKADQERAERQKKGQFTGRELCESNEAKGDEGSEADDAEFKELLRLKKLADEEAEARVAELERGGRLDELTPAKTRSPKGAATNGASSTSIPAPRTPATAPASAAKTPRGSGGGSGTPPYATPAPDFASSTAMEDIAVSIASLQSELEAMRRRQALVEDGLLDAREDSTDNTAAIDEAVTRRIQESVASIIAPYVEATIARVREEMRAQILAETEAKIDASNDAAEATVMRIGGLLGAAEAAARGAKEAAAAAEEASVSAEQRTARAEAHAKDAKDATANALARADAAEASSARDTAVRENGDDADETTRVQMDARFAALEASVADAIARATERVTPRRSGRARRTMGRRRERSRCLLLTTGDCCVLFYSHQTSHAPLPGWTSIDALRE